MAADPSPSTAAPIAPPPVLISGATVLTGTGTRLDGPDVLLQDGKVAAIGTGLTAPAGAVRVDGSGKWVPPRLIDLQPHLGLSPTPGARPHSPANAAPAPFPHHVCADHSVLHHAKAPLAAVAGGLP